MIMIRQSHLIFHLIPPIMIILVIKVLHGYQNGLICKTIKNIKGLTTFIMVSMNQITLLLSPLYNVFPSINHLCFGNLLESNKNYAVRKDRLHYI